MSTPRQALVDLMLDRWGGDDESKAEYEDAADAMLRVLVEHVDMRQVREQIDRAVCSDWPNFQKIELAMAAVAEILAARDAAVERAERAEAYSNEGHWACGRCGGTSQTHAAGGSNQGCLYEPTLESPHLLRRAERAEAELAAAVERAEEAEGYRELAADECDKAIRDVGVLGADLAAARMQVRVRDARLDQVRKWAEHPLRADLLRELLAILDASARPAGEDNDFNQDGLP
jgi:hypothetical protein